MKIIVQPKYKNQENAIRALITNFETDGVLIVKGSRNSIKSNFLGNEEVNIKFFQKPTIFKSIIYSFFRPTKAKRSFEYATFLIENNILTPFPIAYIENRNKVGFLKESYYICHHITYDFTIRELIHNPLFPERNIILEQFTEFTYRMHEASVNFLDHSPGNTLILKKENSQYEFYLIDLNRMNFKQLSIENRIDNFKKMWLSKKMVKIVSRKYAKLCNQPEAKLHQILLEKTKAFKGKITRKKYWKRKLKLMK